jgi:hypothetical protein
MRTVCALVHLLSANLPVKQNLRLGIFKTKAPTFPSTTNSTVCVGLNIHGERRHCGLIGLMLNFPCLGLYISCLKALCNAIGFGFLPIGCPQGDKKNGCTQKPFSQKSSGHSNQKSKEPTLFPTADNFPTCVGPNIHGGAEAMRAGRLDVLDLFASFWIKPKRRGTAPFQNRSVKEPTLVPNKQIISQRTLT